jgi:hypothetical protein
MFRELAARGPKRRSHRASQIGRQRPPHRHAGIHPRPGTNTGKKDCTPRARTKTHQQHRHRPTHSNLRGIRYHVALLRPEFENPQTLNLYSYVRNNPLRSTDPDGHLHEECTHSSSSTQDASGTIHVTVSMHCQFVADAGDNWEKRSVIPAFNFLDRHPMLARAFMNFNGPPCTNPNGCVTSDVMPWGMTGGFQSVPGLMRMRLLSEAEDPKLRNIIEALYKDTSSFGDGGTADAIEYEKATGQKIGGRDHTIKGEDLSRGLQSVLKEPGLSTKDTAIAQGLLNRLQTVLQAKP